MIIDFSAHDTWAKCPGMWYEKYVNRRRKHWPRAQRDDALALGSLVHEGLRVWQLQHIVAIPQAIQDEMNPTRECYDLALELVYGYAQAYPQEHWPLILCEEPVVFPLQWEDVVEERPDHMPDKFTKRLALQGLAKIDSYFYVPEYTEVETGLGFMQMLQPGWWIHEYKTKSPFIPTGLYMQSWEMGLQANYQMMALQHQLQVEYAAGSLNYPHADVQGVLVNVLEKPKRTIPKRKCLTCQEYYEYATWLPTGTGMYACPTCGNRQMLKPLKQDTPTIAPAYYRICVTRTEAEQARARAEMIQVGQRMVAMEQGGLHSEPWNHQNCVDFRWRSTCDYFGVHKNGVSTLEDAEFEAIPDYRGLTQIDGEAA